MLPVSSRNGRLAMGAGRPKQPLVLKDEDRETLERWVRRRTTAQALALRARIVLAAADGATNVAVAEQVGVTKQTVGKWRARFIESGVQGLLDEPRVGRPREVGDETVEQIIVEALENPPPRGATGVRKMKLPRAQPWGMRVP